LRPEKPEASIPAAATRSLTMSDTASPDNRSGAARPCPIDRPQDRAVFDPGDRKPVVEADDRAVPGSAVGDADLPPRAFLIGLRAAQHDGYPLSPGNRTALKLVVIPDHSKATPGVYKAFRSKARTSFDRSEKCASGVVAEQFAIADASRQHCVRGVPRLLADAPRGDPGLGGAGGESCSEAVAGIARRIVSRRLNSRLDDVAVASAPCFLRIALTADRLLGFYAPSCGARVSVMP
jgi:hypothetical protein